MMRPRRLSNFEYKRNFKGSAKYVLLFPRYPVYRGYRVQRGCPELDSCPRYLCCMSFPLLSDPFLSAYLQIKATSAKKILKIQTKFLKNCFLTYVHIFLLTMFFWLYPPFI
ncbi:hypothetical protein XENOCAPTIV_017273 [Xenoophorus captivus]|uniref:Uncharacterized protein n=1 Tax=Xenoophorus captivus TaxID=1517983 RepID=A0ABV0QV01_9TELE